MTISNIIVPGFRLQEDPKIYVASISGFWLLARTTPSWRITDPETGFQRSVREDRARAIALAVLDQGRTFPNAIVLATNVLDFNSEKSNISIPENIKFLVVDGQHRLWAQKYSNFVAQYACVIHMGLSEVNMAYLFLEINDNQKKVSPSLRWDLVRLVRPEDDPFGIAASELIYSLATETESPLFQRIDLTGEQSEISLKQASIAPEIKPLLSKKSLIRDLSFDQQYRLLLLYFLAVKELDPDNWGTPDGVFYKARVFRALIRLLADIINHEKKHIIELTFEDFLPYLKKIDPSTLSSEEIRAAQGSAGIKEIYERIYNQVFSGGY